MKEQQAEGVVSKNERNDVYGNVYYTPASLRYLIYDSSVVRCLIVTSAGPGPAAISAEIVHVCPPGGIAISALPLAWTVPREKPETESLQVWDCWRGSRFSICKRTSLRSYLARIETLQIDRRAPIRREWDVASDEVKSAPDAALQSNLDAEAFGQVEVGMVLIAERCLRVVNKVQPL